MRPNRYATATVATAICAALLTGSPISPATAAPTERTPSGDILFDKCPRSSALIRRPVALEEALAALWRKLPVVYYNVTWAQGRHGPINHNTVAVGQAVKLALVPGDAGKFYRAALPFCGTTVAQNSWAFRVGFANAPNVVAAGHVAFLAKTQDGWRLYGGATS
jgi:hypothetical protein